MRISQFQKYSQKENTVTNNVLLMLSRLNDLSVDYFKTLIEQINEESEIQTYDPQPIFSQQRAEGNGIIDGHIEVKPSKILIETKLNQKELVEKLVKYGQFFQQTCQNQLWHLSSKKFELKEEELINDELKRLYPNISIAFINIQFVDLIENLEGIFETHSHDKELELLTKDFKLYCHESHLVTNDEFKLLFVPSGKSFSWNKKHKMYYCPKNRHKQQFKYFGLYTKKSIRTISEVETVIEADYNSNTKKIIFHGKQQYSDRQIKRLQIALDENGVCHYGNKYYLFPEDDFFETNFIKKSSGGLFSGARYFDLRNFIDVNKNSNSQEVAEKLYSSSWK